MVNGQGHAVMGFSGSKSTEYVGAYTCGRLAGDALGTMGAITLIKSGDASYQRLDGNGFNRWGDYSYTSLDPNDDMSIWTIQEYASNVSTNIWGTWTAQLLAPPPVLMPPNASGCPGQMGIMVNLMGQNFYDPGPGYTNRLAVQIPAPGVMVAGVAYNGPALVTVMVNVGPATPVGSYPIMLINPDGQAAMAPPPMGFNVTAPPPPPTSLQANPPTICMGNLSMLSALPGPGGNTINWFVGPGCVGLPFAQGLSVPVNPTVTTTYSAQTAIIGGTCVSPCAGQMVTVTVLPPAPPMVISQSPPRDTTVDVLTSVEVTFSNPVTGLQPMFLMVNGSPAMNVTGSGAGPYTFTGFIRPHRGPADVMIMPGTFFDICGNPFPGDMWLYQVTCPYPGDFDGNCAVDQFDLDMLILCADGPSLPYAAGCSLPADGLGIVPADFDADGDVDVIDFGVLQRCWSGLDHVPEPTCAQ
jgi:hypothetical protein